MKLLQRGVALALLTTFTLASETALAYEQDKTYKITVLHTNDHHGHFWRNEYGEYGLAAQKTLVDGIRKEVAAEGGSVLLLSGGDINTGVPESDLQDAEPDFRGMNLVGYDAMAIGNHEFDNPLTVLRQQEKWAKFPLLSANIYQKSTGERLFKPWALFKRQDLKIAVIGLTTDDTAKIGNPEYFTDIEFRKPADEAKLVIQELQQTEKPDIIIAATHMGHYDNGEHGSNAPGDVEMARALPGRIAGDDRRWPLARSGLHGGRKQKTGRLRAGYAMQTGSTKRHLDCARRMSGANTWDGLILSFVMAK